MKHFIIAILICIIAACSRTGKLIPPDIATTLPDPNGVTINIVNDSIPASNDTAARIIVTANADIMKKYSEVNLEISTPGKFSNNAATIKSSFNSNGQAVVFATSAQDGITYVTATVGKIVKTTKLIFYKVKTDTLELSLVKDNVIADNYSYAEIIAVTKAPNLSTANRKVVFTTDKGSFANGATTYEVQTGANDTTRAYLKCTKAELAHVTATIAGSYSKELNIRFITAWPAQVFIEPDSITLVSSFAVKTTIKARLFRFPGTVSDGQLVQFYDSTENNKHIGIFLNTTLANSQGEAMTEYRLQDTTFKGFVYIKGFVQTDTGRVMGINRVLIH